MWGKAKFFALVAILLAAGQSFAQAEAQNQWVLATKILNIRQDSTVNSPILGKTKEKETLKAVGEKYGWYKVILPARFKAFVYANYAKVEDGYVVPKSGNLNIRNKPSKKAAIIGTLKIKEKVKYIRRLKNWYEISPYPFAFGWVIKKHIRILDKEEIAKRAKEKEIAAIKQKTNLESPSPLIGSGILRKRNPSLNCPANYSLGNSQGNILLEIKGQNTTLANLLLGKKVEIKGKVKEELCVYVEVTSIQKKQ